MSEWVPTRLADVMSLDLDVVEVDKYARYPIVGVLNRGRGLLRREAIGGDETSYKTLNRIGPGQIVYSRLKAFEGAITVAQLDLEEHWFASPEFPTFTCNLRLIPEFFALITTTPALWDALRHLSTGMGGRRERVKPSSFLTIEIDLPPLSQQRRIVQVMTAVDAQIAALEVDHAKAWAVLSVAREEVLSRSARVQLSSVSSITAPLVDPRVEPYLSMIHVGVEAIEKGTGCIVGARTAREDGLISGKYLFQPGDVIYAKIRPNLRKVAIATDSGLCSADAYPLTPMDGLTGELLRECLLLEGVVSSVVAKSGRTKMPKVNRTELMSTEVPLGDPDGWERVTTVLGAIRDIAEALAGELAALRCVRSDLLSALLSQDITVDAAVDQFVEGAA